MSPRRRLRAASSYAEEQARRRRFATIATVALVAAAVPVLSNQYGKTYTLAREQTRLEQRRRDLIADNARLRDEIERLQTDDRYIEQIARRDLGLVRPGEVELLLVPSGESTAPPAPAAYGDGVVRTSVPHPSGDTARTAGRTAGDDAARSGMPRLVHRMGGWATGVRDMVLRLLRAVAH